MTSRSFRSTAVEYSVCIIALNSDLCSLLLAVTNLVEREKVNSEGNDPSVCCRKYGNHEISEQNEGETIISKYKSVWCSFRGQRLGVAAAACNGGGALSRRHLRSWVEYSRQASHTVPLRPTAVVEV